MKIFISLLISTIVLSCLTAFAEVDFDASQYTTEELQEIISKARTYIPITSEADVLYDQDGIYIEYHGLEYDSTFNNTMLNILIRNNTGYDLIFKLDGINLNNAKVSTSNGRIEVENNTLFLTAPNYSMLIDTDDLAAYGFDTISSIDAPLEYYSEDGEIYGKMNLHADIDYQLN